MLETIFATVVSIYRCREKTGKPKRDDAAAVYLVL